MRLYSNQKKRLAEETFRIVCILSAGFVYYLIVTLFNVKIPCVFYEVTGLLCPGCGVTRMVLSIAKFDFYSAYGYNRLIFLTIPVIFYILASCEKNYVINGSRMLSKGAKILAFAEFVLLVLFGIIRNLI